MAFCRKFYVADTHFGHENIIGHCSRPFSSVDEMDQYLIDQWNSVVCDDDIVYHLGDLSVPDPVYARRIFDQLNGRKILILGNHDEKRPGSPSPHIVHLDWYRQPTSGLSVTDTDPYGNKVHIYLSHYAHRTWPHAAHGGYHFYGHSHAAIPHLGLSRDVGVDVDDVAFRPRTFTELAAGLPGLPSAIS